MERLVTTDTFVEFAPSTGKILSIGDAEKFGVNSKHPGNMRSFFRPPFYEDLIKQVWDLGKCEHWSYQRVPSGEVFVHNDCELIRVDGKPVIRLAAKEIRFLSKESKAFKITSDFSLEDQLIYGWLSSIKDAHQYLSISYDGALRVDVKERKSAKRLLSEAKRRFAKTLVFDRLQIFHKGDLYADVLPSELFHNSDSLGEKINMEAVVTNGNSLSSWVRQNQNLFHSFPRANVYIHKADLASDFQILDVRPHLTTKRLNRPPEEIIGKPISVLDPALADFRRFHMRELLKSQNFKKFDYSYRWDDRSWFFDVTLSYNATHQEIISIITDKPVSSCDFDQEQYWLDRLPVS